MPFLTDEEEQDIIDNKHCSKCGCACLDKVSKNTYHLPHLKRRIVDFQCVRCGFTTRYIREEGYSYHEIMQAQERIEHPIWWWIKDFFRGKK